MSKLMDSTEFAQHIREIISLVKAISYFLETTMPDDLDPELIKLVERCLRLDSKDRPIAYAELKVKFREYKLGEPSLRALRQQARLRRIKNWSRLDKMELLRILGN